MEVNNEKQAAAGTIVSSDPGRTSNVMLNNGNILGR